LKDETEIGIDMFADQIVARERRHHARHFCRARYVDLDDAGVRVRAA
jgi:hypothetical protein